MSKVGPKPVRVLVFIRQRTKVLSHVQQEVTDIFKVVQ